MDSAGEFDIIFSKRLYGCKCCAGPLKNIEKQTDALLHLFVRVNNDFVVVIVNKTCRQARFQFTPPGLA